MGDIHDILKELLTSEKKAVLGTIVRVEGSSYMKEGTCIVIFEDETYIGCISPGCLESDLVIWAKECMETEASRIVKYDLSNTNDFGKGEGPGWNRSIQILLQPVTIQLRTKLSYVKADLEAGHSVLHMIEFTTDYKLINQFFVKYDNHLTNGPVELNVPLDLKRKKDRLLFVNQLEPKPRLFLFGANMDAIPVAELASRNGFSVQVCDWRPQLCSKENFPTADNLLIGQPKEIMDEIQFTHNDYVLVMTHVFQKDEEITSYIFQQGRVKYLGLLGPKKRSIQLLNQRNFPEWVHAPVGNPIGAVGPEEMAVSIVAELIQTRRSLLGQMV
ncbi:XdhC family protein [Cytobacillus sp. FJAT-54145]|uniref:XdhC family protein n=1 Tax=Cytobacillus spartinae TaxID=3299023 RepID=A0ABW6K8D9_9BACI